jgi:hypothetical protein
MAGHSKKQTEAQQRNWRIFRLRGMAAQLWPDVFTSEERTEIKRIINNALARNNADSIYTHRVNEIKKYEPEFVDRMVNAADMNEEEYKEYCNIMS